MSATLSINSFRKLQHRDVVKSGRERTKRKRTSDCDDSSGRNGQTKRPNNIRKTTGNPTNGPKSSKAAKLLESDGSQTRLPDSVADFDGLNQHSTSSSCPSRFYISANLFVPSLGIVTQARIEEPLEQHAKLFAKLCDAGRTILECVGEDPDRPGLVDTPKRYAKAIMFFTKGYQQNVRDIVNNAIFHEGHNEMVVVKDIEIFSMCEHHMVPFTGKMHIGYIPYQSVIGISKLPRIAEMFSRRLQIQERLTKEVATAIMEVLQPQGVAVIMQSSHLCMVMRGVEKSAATTVTSCVLGCFETKEKTWNEFLRLVDVKS